MELGPIGLVGFALATRHYGGPELEPIAASDAADAGARTRATQAAERIAALPAENRRLVLDRLHAGESRVPWARVHATWVRHALERCPRPWIPWAVEPLPVKLRGLVQRAAGDLRIVDDVAPEWFRPWMERTAHRRLGVPQTLPAERAANAADDAIEELLHGRNVPLRAVVTTLGVVGFVSHLRSLPRPEAHRLLSELPPELQAVAARLIERKGWVEDPFWSATFPELASRFAKPLDRMLHLGIADIVRAGIQAGRQRDLRSLALRLPRSFGLWLVEQIDAAPEWTKLAVQPSFEDWNTRLLDLVRGAAAAPAEEAAEADEADS